MSNKSRIRFVPTCLWIEASETDQVKSEWPMRDSLLWLIIRDPDLKLSQESGLIIQAQIRKK